MLALAPVHTSVAYGQSPVLATAALAGAMLLEQRASPRWAGALYGLATALKVQLGLPFVAYLLWKRRWSTAGAAAVVILVFTVVGVAPMKRADPAWSKTWATNLAHLSGAGGYNDAGVGGTNRSSLINLQYGLHTLIANRGIVNAITFMLVGAAALTVVVLIPGRRPSRELLALSGVAVLCLLVFYHRSYDAALLALPIAWAIGALATRERIQGILVLALSASFLAPLPVMLTIAKQQGALPEWLTETLLWDTVLVPMHVWALVLLAVVLLWAAGRSRAPGPTSLNAARRGQRPTGDPPSTADPRRFAEAP